MTSSPLSKSTFGQPTAITTKCNDARAVGPWSSNRQGGLRGWWLGDNSAWRRSAVCGALLSALAVVGTGCSEEPRFELAVVQGAPIYPADVERVDVAIDGYVNALAARSDGAIVGTSTGASSIRDGQIVDLDVWSVDVPEQPGAVTAIARLGEQHLVVAEQRLLASVGDRLVPSELGAEVEALAPKRLYVAGLGAAASLLLGADSGLYEVQAGVLLRHDIPDEAGAPRAVGRQGALLVVAYGNRLYEIDNEVLHRVPFDTGLIHDIDNGPGGTLLIATDRGLFERAPDGAYKHFTLSNGAPSRVVALAHSLKDGTYGLSTEGAFAVDGSEELRGVVANDGLELDAIAADDVGQLWLGGNTIVRSVAVGSPIGFAADVAPVLEQYCASCHADGVQGAPQRDLVDYEISVALAESIRARIENGSMPPPGSPALDPDAYEVILRWVASGATP